MKRYGRGRRDALYEKISGFIRNAAPYDHICHLYGGLEKKRSPVSVYLAASLEGGEAVLCATEETPEQILRALEGFAIDVDRYQKEGR